MVITHDARIAAIHKARVNVKSLAAEARFIRQEARRAGPAYRDELTSHRRGKLREEARYAQLAMAFIRGRAYRTVEEKTIVPVNVVRLTEKVRRWWWTAKADDIREWAK